VCALPDLADKEKFPVVYRKTPTDTELEEGYVRFKLTEDLVSPMAPVGTKGGNYLCSGITHDEVGRPASGAKLHHTMQHKRIAKLEPIRERGDLVRVQGDLDAEQAVMSWGYSVGPVKAAVEKLRSEGNKIKFIYPLLLSPLPVKRFNEVLGGVKKLAVVENNYTGQLANYLRMELDLPETVKVTRAGGAVWQPEEVIMRLKETLLS
jgi:2-oxoglutarate ferredoxin oxidoreductase subunit alpha